MLTPKVHHEVQCDRVRRSLMLLPESRTVRPGSTLAYYYGIKR